MKEWVILTCKNSPNGAPAYRYMRFNADVQIEALDGHAGCAIIHEGRKIIVAESAEEVIRKFQNAREGMQTREG